MSYGAGPSLAGTLAFSGVNGSSAVPNSGTADGTSDCMDDGPGDYPGNGGSGDGGSCRNPGAGGSDPWSGNGDAGGYSPVHLDHHIPDPPQSGNMSFYQFYRGYFFNHTLDSLGSTCAPPGGVPAGCVAPATRISLFPEGCLAAGEVQIGDCVRTCREDGTIGGELVTGIRASTQPCVLLETEDGRQLHCSLSHEVMVANEEFPQGKRTLITALTLADRLLTEEGKAVALKSMVRQPDGPVLLICLVGPQHTYISDGLWSHNDIHRKAITWPEPPAGP